MCLTACTSVCVHSGSSSPQKEFGRKLLKPFFCLVQICTYVCVCWQKPTHPSIRVRRPAQFGCGHASVHHGLCRGERKGGRERQGQRLASEKLFWVSFHGVEPHSSPGDRLTQSLMNSEEMNPPKRFIRLCSTSVKTRDMETKLWHFAGRNVWETLSCW